MGGILIFMKIKIIHSSVVLGKTIYDNNPLLPYFHRFKKITLQCKITKIPAMFSDIC